METTKVTFDSFICMNCILIAEPTFLRIGYLNIALGNGENLFCRDRRFGRFPASPLQVPTRVLSLCFDSKSIESAAVDDDVVSAAEK